MKNIIIALIYLLLSLNSSAQQIEVERSKYEVVVKEILNDIYINYNEISKKETPLEINTNVTVIQNKEPDFNNKEKLDTSISFSSSHIQHNLAIVRNEEDGEVYLNNDFFITVDKKAKQILLRDPKDSIQLREETASLRKRNANIVDSLTNCLWLLNNNILTITKEFPIQKESEFPSVQKIVMILNLETKQMIMQEIEYQNYFLKSIKSSYQYLEKPKVLQEMNITSLLKNSNYSSYSIEDKRSKK